MEQTNIINLPVIGMVQHGKQVPTANGGTRAKELGYFIAKIQDNYMINFLQKFDEQYKGKQYIEIEFPTNNPLSKKFVRYNQGGDVCHCIEGNNTGSQKTKNGWKPIECNIKNCQYRQKNEQGKTACNRIGWLKFFIPSISKDRIWLMKITSQSSINKLSSYIDLQKAQGNSLIGSYVLFLKQEEQESKATGQKFNNYVLDILKKEDFIFQNTIPKTIEKTKELSTKDSQTVDNNVQDNSVLDNNIQKKNDNATTPKNKTKVVEKTEKTKTKTASKKVNSTTEKNDVATSKVEDKKQTDKKELSLDNCYVLIKTFTQNIKQKNGEIKPYVMGEFYDMKDKQFNVAINPKDVEELQECDMGTVAKLDLQTIGDVHFALGIEYVEKCKKNVAA